jgi:beta-lactamase regulating signal transducer with metallopeptidase domain
MVFIFENLLKTSLYSCLIVIIIFIFRIIFKKASRSVICLLWVLLGIRLVFLFPIESRFAVIPEISESALTDNLDIKTNTYGMDVVVLGESNTLNNYLNINNEGTLPQSYSEPIESVKNQSKDSMIEIKEERANSSIIRSFEPLKLLSCIWVLGTFGMLFYGIIKIAILKRKLLTSIRDAYDKNVFYTECTKSAFIYGICRPRIYVGFCVEESEKTYIISHEREHLRRGDHITKLIGFILLSLYWFAPWIWVAFVLFCKDMELACDEGLIKAMDSEQRAKYAGALYKYGSIRMLPGFGMVQFGEVSIKERIKKIMEFRKKSKWISFVMIAVLIASIVIFIPVRNSKATDSNDDNALNEKYNTLSDETSLSQENIPVYMKKDKNIDGEDVDKLFRYLNTETRELFIPTDVTEISDLDVFYLCRLHVKDRPVHIVVDEGNNVFDSRENCDAIIEKSTGKLVLGCGNTIIPNSVTEIADNAFANCAELTNIKIPDNVTKIGKNAFAECGNLQEVILPEGVTEIGIGAFSTCGSLSSVSLPESVIYIRDYAFGYCGRLTQINLSTAVMENGLGVDSFTGCFSLNKNIKDAIMEKNQNAYRLNLQGDDLSNVEYHFKEEAPDMIDYPDNSYYAVLDSLDQFGNLSMRVVEYSQDSSRYIFTGEKKIIKISNDCKIIVKGKTEKSEEKLRYLNQNDLRYICNYYTVAMDSENIEEIIMHEYVYPFICVEENNEIVMLREKI